MNSGEKAILSTLCYADVFDYPLTERELWHYHIGKQTTLEKFRFSLGKLLRQKLIVQHKGFFVLKKSISLVTLRTKRARAAVEKMKVAGKAARLLSHIPTVWLVGVSGALAVANAPADDDIDLFVITAPHTLWTTRFLATILLDLVRLRRRPGATDVKNMICLNMFLDASRLVLPKREQDLYSAHEVAQLKPLVNKEHIHEQFLTANGWVKTFLPHALKRPSVKKSVNRNGPLSILTWFEGVSRGIQLWYMQRRRTSEVIGKDLLRFHPQDARRWVLVNYEEKVREAFASRRNVR